MNYIMYVIVLMLYNLIGMNSVLLVVIYLFILFKTLHHFIKQKMKIKT